MTTLVVDVYEERVVATSDTVGDCLNALMENFLAMKLEGRWYIIWSKLTQKHIQSMSGWNMVKIHYTLG